jgi:hypothetical protein
VLGAPADMAQHTGPGEQTSAAVVAVALILIGQFDSPTVRRVAGALRPYGVSLIADRRL